MKTFISFAVYFLCILSISFAAIADSTTNVRDIYDCGFWIDRPGETSPVNLPEPGKPNSHLMATQKNIIRIDCKFPSGDEFIDDPSNLRSDSHGRTKRTVHSSHYLVPDELSGMKKLVVGCGWEIGADGKPGASWVYSVANSNKIPIAQSFGVDNSELVKDLFAEVLQKRVDAAIDWQRLENRLAKTKRRLSTQAYNSCYAVSKLKASLESNQSEFQSAPRRGTIRATPVVN